MVLFRGAFFFLLTNVPIRHTEERTVSSRGSGGKVWHPHINKLDVFPSQKKIQNRLKTFRPTTMKKLDRNPTESLRDLGLGKNFLNSNL